MAAPTPAFATDEPTAEYYDRRAPTYDEWYTNDGAFAARSRPGWAEAVAQLEAFVADLPPARTLDIACGTGFLTRHLKGYVVGLDQSPTMAAIAQSRLPDGLVMVGDALEIKVSDGAFDRVFTGHFYGHLSPEEQSAFRHEARRVAGELIVVDAARRPEIVAEGWQERILPDGSRHQIYKRYFEAAQLADEIGGQVLLDGPWFVAASAVWPAPGK
jgi:demethylmenaquinone methyltransferase/2-methoxy-6-polyprenyl-1,4-benzoquinol methylase